MTRKRTILLLTVSALLLLSIIPAISAQRIPPMLAKYLGNLLKNPKNIYKGFKQGKNAHDVLDYLGSTNAEAAKQNPPTNSDLLEGGFYITFTVNNQEIDALIAINYALTVINNYNYKVFSPNYLCCQPDFSSSSTCTPYMPSNPTECFTSSGDYIAAADLFVFGQVGSYKSNFLWSQANYDESETTANGVLSFNNYNNYSILYQFQHRRFSYYFSFTRDSNVTFEVLPDTSRLQSVQLLQNTKNQGYEKLYYVPPPEISIGSQKLDINTDTDFKYGVVIDTLIPFIYLATNVHDQVISALLSQIGRQQVQTADGVCFDDTPDWPDLTLKFPSGARMVLKRDNYVVTDSKTGFECAKIYESSGVSVLGTIAQLDRTMSFDVANSTLYFDKYPQTQTGPSATNTGTTILFDVVILCFSLIVLV